MRLRSPVRRPRLRPTKQHDDISAIRAFIDPLFAQLDQKLADAGPALTAAKNTACTDLEFESADFKGAVDGDIASEV